MRMNRLMSTSRGSYSILSPMESNKNERLMEEAMLNRSRTDAA